MVRPRPAFSDGSGPFCGSDIDDGLRVSAEREKETNMERASGVLMPVSSLPGIVGIGTFGREA